MRCVAQSPQSTPIRHPHRLFHPSFPADDPQARRVPRWEDATPLSRLSHDWVSCLQINRPDGLSLIDLHVSVNGILCRQPSQDGEADRRHDPAERARASGSSDSVRCFEFRVSAFEMDKTNPKSVSAAKLHPIVMGVQEREQGRGYAGRV